MRAASHPDQRIRVFRSGGHDAARTVIFEGPADKMHIVGQQGRCQRVALISLIGLAIKGEGDRLATVDPATMAGARDLVGKAWTENS